MRRKLAAGNWKMNGTQDSLDVIAALAEAHATAIVDILVCPPATLIAAAAAGSGPVAIGGQDCHMAESGAHTGDISPLMLRDAGASHVILGHSERRQDHGEDDDMVCAKARAAIKAGLVAVICVGESLAERDAGTTLDVISGQLAGSVPDAADGADGASVVIAYEPIWAIGTGKVPTMAQIGDVHDHIRARLEDRFGPEVGQAIRVLYGGSVKAGNAADIFAVRNVDGALVGGASLTVQDFSPIVTALEAAG